MKIDVVSLDKGIYLIKKNGKYFRISEVSLDVLNLAENGVNHTEIVSFVNTKYSLSISEEYVEKMTSNFSKAAIRNKHRYIWGAVKIINLDKTRKLLKVLSYAFSIPVLISVVIIFCILAFNVRLFEFNYSFANINSIVSDNYLLGIIFFVISFFITLIHEFGHASACYKFDACPKEIGFGFYIFFPVMYTDVSSSWELSRKKRLIVDCAGFYFQIITITLLLVIIKVYEPFSLIGKALIYQNLLLIAYNLNPLFRFDGYWIFSDVFNISNLRSKATISFSEMTSNLHKLFTRKQLTKRRYPYIVYFYALFSNLFMVVVVMLFLRFAYRKIISFTEIIISHQYNNVDWIIETFGLVSVIVGGVFISRTLYNKFGRKKQ